MGSNLRPDETNSRLFLPLPSSSTPSFPEQFLHPGLTDGDIRRTDFAMSSGLLMRNAALRQLEKEWIREEIIAEEIMRRRELELEVRREMAIERELALRRVEGFSSLPGLGFEGRLPFPTRATEVGDLGNAPFQRPPVVPDLGNGHVGKVVFLAKPPTRPNVSGTIRKVAGVGNIKLPIAGSKKKPHKEWGCALCKVSASCEQALNDHLQGKKHKEMVAELKANKAAKKKTGSSILLEKKTDGHIKLSKNPGVPKSKHGKKQWSCTLCQVSTTCEQGLNDHLQGKSHKAKEAEQMANKTTDNHPKSYTIWQKKIDKQEANPMAEDVSKNGSNFWCRGCNIHCTSEADMASHQQGKKHMARVESQKQNFATVAVLGTSDTSGEGVGSKVTYEESVDNVEGKVRVVKEAEEEANKTTDNRPKSYTIWQKKTDKQEGNPMAEDVNKNESNFWCRGCNIHCTSEADMASHQKGKKHMARVELQKQNFATVAVLSTSDTSGEGVGSEVAYEESMDNVEGKVHAVKEAEEEANKTTDNQPGSYTIWHEKTEQQELKPLAEDVNRNESNFWCQDCNLRCTSEADLASHQKGKRHKARVESQKQNFATIAALGTSDTSGEGVGSKVTYEESMDNVEGKVRTVKEAEEEANKTTDNHRWSYTIWHDKTEQQEVKPLAEDVNWNESNFLCQDCNVRCTSEADMASHQKGKKHMAQLESQKQNLSTIALLGTSDSSEGEVGSDVTYEEGMDNVDGEVHAVKEAEEEAIDNVDGEVHAAKAADEEATKALDSPANKKTGEEATEALEKTTNESIKHSNSSGIPTAELGKKQEEKPTLEELKKKFKFWCEDCQVGCHCETVMASHQKGKKHTRLQAQKKILATVSFSTSQNDGDAGGKGDSCVGRNGQAMENVNGEVAVDDEAREETIKAVDLSVDKEAGREATEALEKNTDKTINHTNSTMVPSPEHGKEKEEKPMPEDLKKKFKFWCDDCQIGCHSEVVMGDHQKGKKHLARLCAKKENCAAVSAVATPKSGTCSEEDASEERFEEALENFDGEIDGMQEVKCEEAGFS